MNNELRKIIETRLKNAKANAFNLGTETITGKMFLGKAELLESILDEYVALTIPAVSRSNNIKYPKIFVLNDEFFMYEDELPEMTDEQYDEWYETSFVYMGVRVGKVVITT